MEIALVVLILLVVLGGIIAGQDSRIDENARRRRYLG